MARKSAKRSAKRPASNNKAPNVQKAEKDFYQVPAKLAASFNKDINAHQKQQNKLNKALVKCAAQAKKADAKEKAAAVKAKTSSSGKKLWKAAQKVQAQVAKLHADLNKQAQIVATTLAELLNKQAKFTALNKYVSQFEKEWAKTAKELKAKVKAKAKKSTKPKMATVKIAEEANSQVENFPSSVDNVGFDEPTELAS